MPRHNINDLLALRAVARERSFTRAAAQMGISPSALSHTIRGFEERLGVRLLARTTRSVAPTQAGERLLAAVGPRLDEIDAELAAITALGDRPSGTVRINATRHAIETVLWPRLAPVLREAPDIVLELTADIGMVDIVADGYDAGVRIGEQVARDMIAVRIGPDLQMTVVGSPAYFESRGKPSTPHDLARHDCINLRLPTRGGLYAWEFERRGRDLNVRVEGRLVFNDPDLMIAAALEGFGLAYVLTDRVADDLASGRLVQALEDWCEPYAGYHLYFPSRRQQSAAFALIVEALRYKG